MLPPTCWTRGVLRLALSRTRCQKPGHLTAWSQYQAYKMNWSTLVHSLLLLAATGVATGEHGERGVPSVPRKERAAALRNEYLGGSSKRSSSSSSSSSPLVQSRDLKPSSPGVSYHWAGAVVPPPPGENITSVTATITLPELAEPGDVREGPGGEYFLYVWVGIDGLDSVDPGDCNALWQTGFAGQIVDGVTTWWGWVC